MQQKSDQLAYCTLKEQIHVSGFDFIMNIILYYIYTFYVFLLQKASCFRT